MSDIEATEMSMQQQDGSIANMSGQQNLDDFLLAAELKEQYDAILGTVPMPELPAPEDVFSTEDAARVDWSGVVVDNATMGELAVEPLLLDASCGSLDEGETTDLAWELGSPDTPDSDTVESCSQDEAEAELELPEDVLGMGYRDERGAWRCLYKGCNSKRIFTRACDLRKHWGYHFRNNICTMSGCGAGFATKRDLRRHLASHSPSVSCVAPRCPRVFSRHDNMRDHYNRIHKNSRIGRAGLSFRFRRPRTTPR
ncbi:hypothetical protein K504DRAFT_539306 [Pleomassaria siparia CBS 279.74]|uniref:C2H2-type domain-containing protein n=1 Tax=Pleomassaria siparia CBS 279.74 TaxID=1314801 RepID=A0A6G1JRK6_9PLEO|nr:hypothetical protein K504DRAFT_539306 [Pleomassaria siparia CBS 279.74]